MLVVSLLLLGAGCQKTAMSSLPSQPANTLPREFSFADVKVGDRIEGLVVTKIEPRHADQPLSANNVAIYFDGEKSVSGTLSQSDLTGGYCLQETPSLPRMIENPDMGLCFPYAEMTNAILKEREGDLVTVTIKNLVLMHGVEDGNIAELKL